METFKESEMNAGLVYIDSLGASSKHTMRSALMLISEFFDSTRDGWTTFPWYELRYEHAQKLRTFLLSTYRARTTNKVLSAFRGVLYTAWKLKQMSTDDYHRAKDVKVAKIDDPPTGRRLSLEELRKLVFVNDDLRDAAIVTVFYAAGLRRFEVSKLRVGDYDRQTGQFFVHGKGNKTRNVTINKGWRVPIEKWLDSYQGKAELPLFPSRAHQGSLAFRKTKQKFISCSGLAQILEERRLIAGVAPFTSHDLRRTFISNLIDKGVDLVTIKRIVGHAHVNTTAAYDRRDKTVEIAAIERLDSLFDEDWNK